MITFPKPVNLNGAELIDELLAAGVRIADSDLPKRHKNKKPPYDNLDGTISLDINPADEAKAAAVIAAHDGNTIPTEATIEEKLASAGVNLDDLKAALGL